MESSMTSKETGLPLLAAMRPQDQEVSASPNTDLEVALSPINGREMPTLSDPMEEFSHRFSGIVLEHGSAQALVDEDTDDAVESDVSQLLQMLEKHSTPEDKLLDLLQRFNSLALSYQRQRDERRSRQTAQLKLEMLVKDLTSHFESIREEALQRSLEDTERRSHFQNMLTEIQTQIETHSARNDKLCRENAALTEKLETLMNQCEQRDQSLEKVDKHYELQLRLSEAKLQQAEAQLTEALDRHKREKEYLLREAIEKTKKCFTMKEQELNMKKKLTLYSQKFDEFQETLAKSNEIYVRFKKEMENMSEKMKKLEKESNVWKTRFENCNKALNDMMQERTERGHEYDVFVLKIQRLEKLCRALQEERSGLYSKIKEVQQAGASRLDVALQSKSTEQTEVATEVQEANSDLTDNMVRLRVEQMKLQEFAAALLSPPAALEEEAQEDLELDLVSSAFVHFHTKAPVTQEPAVGAAKELTPDSLQENTETQSQ